MIAIDGPAGVGKSTVARLVAARLGLRHVDTGAMYRELTATALARGVALDDGAALAALVDEPSAEGIDIRSEPVSAAVSTVSGHPQVRARMRERQRAEANDAVLEGRDIGTRVCPDAGVKVYLTAPAAVRAARRAVDLGLPAGDVERSIVRRDALDAEQSAAAADAVVIDTGGLDAEQVAARVIALAEAAR